MNVRKAKELSELKNGSRRDYGQRSKSAGRRSYGGRIQPSSRRRSGKEESHFIRPVARSKVGSIPVGIEAVFLIDELIRSSMGPLEARRSSIRTELWQKKTR